MTQTQYIIGRKLNILELGKTLGNISDAWRSCRTTLNPSRFKQMAATRPVGPAPTTILSFLFPAMGFLLLFYIYLLT
jgi:hypothetical protein